jgi:hypothetical protein
MIIFDPKKKEEEKKIRKSLRQSTRESGSTETLARSSDLWWFACSFDEI